MPLLRYYNGTNWVTPFFLYPKLWNGTDWVYAKPYYYNGTNWLGVTSLDTQNVTIGSYLGGGKIAINYRGFVSSASPILVSISFGSCNTGISTVYPSAPIYQMYSVPGSFVLRIGGSQSNGGWNTLTFGSVSGSFTLSRSTATYATGTTTSWTWSTATDPFGAYADGAVVPVIFG